MKQPTNLSHFFLAFGLILLNFVSCSVFDDAPTPVLARYDLPSEVLDSIFTPDIPKAIRNVDNFLDKIKGNGMVIHVGSQPPEITADGSDEIGKRYIIEHDCIFDEQTPTNVDSLYGKYEETIRIFPNPQNIPMAEVSYSSVGDEDHPLFHDGMDRGSGIGYVSGNGNNFTIFYRVEEGKGSFDDIPYQAIWIVSGTVSDTENARNISNVTKCLVMLQKGDDPDDQVANRGTIRIFKDDNPEWIQPEVVISDFSPTEGTNNTEVTINGSGFGTENDSLTVLFNSKIAEVLNREANQLLVKVPQGAGTGPVTVEVNDKIDTGGVFTYLPEEVVISDFSPTEGPYGTEVTINGSGFGTVNDTLTVLFNGTEAEVLKRDANQLLVIFPQGAGTGPLTVQVNDQTGTGGVFTYIQEEVVITGFSPTEGPYGTEVTIDGSGFGTVNDTLTVLFNGTEAEVLKRDANQLLVIFPQGAGTGPLTVQVNDQTGTGGVFTYIQEEVVITGFSPTEGPYGTEVTIDGSGFGTENDTLTVLFNGTEAEVLKRDANQLLVIFPQGAGTGPLTVQVNDQTGTDGVFTYIQEEVVISGFSPPEGPYGTEVTIDGSGFGTVNDSITVLFNGTEAEVLKRDANQLLVIFPQGAGTGPVTVQVNDQTGTGGVFTYIQEEVVISGFSPPEGPYGTEVTIDGSGFGSVDDSITVLFNGTEAEVLKRDANQLLVIFPQGAGTGPVTVQVNDQTGTGGVFTYIQEEVVISDFSPTEGPYGTEVTIDGSGFGTVNDTLTVLFNGTEAEVLKRDANQLLVIFPQGAGTGPVTVQVNDQTGTGGVFTYIQEEVVITGFSPTEGTYGTEVTIDGSGFGTVNDSLTVLFNGTEAEVLKRGANQLSVIFPQGAGTGPVTVQVNEKTDTGGVFTYIPEGPF